MSFGILDSILILLAIAVTVSVICRRLRLPVILGYLLVGILVGPYGLGWIPDIDNIRNLAEFGVVFLMFTVGLEFSLSRLIALRHAVMMLGSLQVILSILLTTAIGILLGMSLLTALVVGGIVAMSSTAIVTKQLSDQLEINSQHGLHAVGILLFQDLAVIPFLILIASLGTTSQEALPNTLLWAMLKGIMAILLIISTGRWLLRPLFRTIATTRVVELFTLTVLLVTLGAAWLTHNLGLSLALGAFLAGIMLGETEFRHQIEVEIRPFRDVLLGLFFISIGMLLNIKSWGATWQWIGLLVIALIFGKGLLIVTLSRLCKHDKMVSLRTGLVLAQGGEFGFAILTLALSNQVMPPDYGQVILGALLISIAIAPILVNYNQQIANFFFPRTAKIDYLKTQKDVASTARGLDYPVVICGYGRVGQNVARILQKINVDYLALEIDPTIVKNASLAGDTVTYGDATHPEILKSTKLNNASAVLVSYDDNRALIKTLRHVRDISANIPTIVRCRDESDFDLLQRHGADEIVAETFEESLMLAHHLMLAIDVPNAKATKLIQGIRSQRYELLRQVFPGTLTEIPEEESTTSSQLKPVVLPDGAAAVNATVGDINMTATGAKIMAIGQADKPHERPTPKTKLHAGDVVVLYGTPMALEKAERLLLDGLHVGA